MSGVRDLFFDEFYSQLDRVVCEIKGRNEQQVNPPLLASEHTERWTKYVHDPKNRSETLISVDGGVQVSDFAYGDFVASGRALNQIVYMYSMMLC